MGSPIEQQLQDTFWSWFVEAGCALFNLQETVDFDSPEAKATHVARMFPQQTHALAKAFEAGVGASAELLEQAMVQAQADVDAPEAPPP